MNRRARTVLWAFRCGYVKSDSMGLTLKGSLMVPKCIWRLLNRIYCEVSEVHRDEMLRVLKHFSQGSIRA